MVWPCFNSLNVTLICVSILSLFLWEVKSHIPLWLCTWGVWIRIPSVFTHVVQPLKIWASAVRIQPVQSLSRVQLSVTPWTAAHQPSLSLTNCQSCSNSCPSSMMPSIPLILCHPLLLLPSIFRIIRVFSNESALRIRWSKYWSFSFSSSPSNEYLGLISLRFLLGLYFIVPIIQIKKRKYWSTDRPNYLLEDASVSKHHSQDWH